ncbi:MAG: PEP-CTERM sorting domain-containing protein, partial [Burkholderiales bacterium]
NAPNRFINDGLSTTVEPGVFGSPPSGGGTIRLSSGTIPSDPRPAGSFEGNNPVVTAGGRLELSEIRFINTLPPATVGGTRTGKTLAALDGTIVIENLVTVEGGRIEGNTTNRRFEIGNLNTFLGVEFNGTFFAGGRQRLLEGTDISGADFRQIGGPLFLGLGSNQTLGAVRNHQGDVRFASDDPTNRRTLTLGADLYGSGSLGFANLVLAGSGNVYTPVVRIGPNLDLSGYSGVLRPNLGNPLGGGQLRLEGLTITAPLSPKLSYANSTLVLDNSTFDLDGSRLTPASTTSALRLENNSTLRNGTLDATGTNVTVASSRLQQLALAGGTIVVETAIALDRVQPGTASEFNGTDYTVTLGAATTNTPWDLAGGTLRFNSTTGGTISLDTAGTGSNGLPTNGRIAADTIRLIGNLSNALPDANFAAGPSGSLHLIVGNPVYTFTSIDALNVSGGDLRLDYAARSFPNPPPGQIYLNSRDAITVDGRLTVTNAVTLKPANAYYTGSTFLPAAVSARAFTFEGGDLSGLHLRSFVPGGVANVDLNSYATTVLAAADTTTYLNGGTFVIGDPNFVYDPLNPATPTATALVAPPGTGISTAGQVSADGTLVFSGVALTGAVSESVTASGSSYLPRTLPGQSMLGTITAQNITLSNGTVAGMRYESYQDVVSGNRVRRWTQAPNLVATGDPNLGTPGVLRFETGRYALEDNFTYGQLVIGSGATLARRSALVPGFVGDPLAADPDLSPLPDTAAMIEFRAIGFNGYPPAQQHALVFDGGRIEGLTLLSLPEPFSYGSGRSGALVLSRATFAANSSLIGTLDHATGAVTRFEGGYTFALGRRDSFTTEYEPQLLRPAAGLTGADRRFGIEIAALGSAPADATVAVPVATLFEESTRLKGNVTVTGVADPSSSTRARLELQSNGTSYQPEANLNHSDGTLTFAGDLTVVVDGRLRSEDQIVFAAGTELFGTGRVEAVNGITLNGQTLPGNSPGTLTLVGDVTFGDTHDLVLDIGYGTFESDQLVIDGNLTVGGKLTLNFYYGFNTINAGYFSGSAPLLRANSFLGSFSSYEVLGLNDPSDFDPSQFAQILPAGLIAAVPEPSTYALFLAGAGLLTAVIRRRRLAPTPA